MVKQADRSEKMRRTSTPRSGVPHTSTAPTRPDSSRSASPNHLSGPPLYVSSGWAAVSRAFASAAVKDTVL